MEINITNCITVYRSCFVEPLCINRDTACRRKIHQVTSLVVTQDADHLVNVTLRLIFPSSGLQGSVNVIEVANARKRQGCLSR